MTYLANSWDYNKDVALGNKANSIIWNKFGYNNDIDIGVPELISSWGGAFNPLTDIMTSSQTFTITYETVTNGGDGLGTSGATQLLISYLDENSVSQESVHVLSNTGSDVTSFSGLGINRVSVISNGGSGTNNNDITFTATVDATVQAQIPLADYTYGNVTQQCIFHTDINSKLLLKWLYINSIKLSGGGGNPTVTIVGYTYSRVTNSSYEIYRDVIDTNRDNRIELNPKIPFVIGGREVLYFMAETDTNNTAVRLRFSGEEIVNL